MLFNLFHQTGKLLFCIAFHNTTLYFLIGLWFVSMQFASSAVHYNKSNIRVCISIYLLTVIFLVYILFLHCFILEMGCGVLDTHAFTQYPFFSLYIQGTKNFYSNTNRYVLIFFITSTTKQLYCHIKCTYN